MVRRFWTKTKETAGLEGQRRSGEGGHGGGTKRVSETDDGWVDLWTCGLLSVLLCSFLPSFLHLKHPCLWSSWLRPGHVFVDVWQCSRGMFSVLLVEFGRRLTARSGWRWRGWTLRLLSDFVSSLTAWSIYQLSQWGWRMRPRLSGAAFFPPSVSPPVTSMDLLMKGSFSVSSPQLRFLSFRNYLEITHR